MLCAHGSDAPIHVAVATNFMKPMQKISAAFEKKTAQKTVLSFGSSGHLFAQIKNGAPYHAFLSADSSTPRALQKERLSVPHTQFTYAVGRLALWSKNPNLIDQSGEILRSNRFKKIAIAQPKLAPYGRAAYEVLESMRLTDSLRSKIVMGENISQTHQFIMTENAELGFVAQAQIYSDGRFSEGSYWLIPTSMHSAILQDAILLKKGENHPGAQALMSFLKNNETQEILRSYGYTVP